jgi:hypothetical protein
VKNAIFVVDGAPAQPGLFSLKENDGNFPNRSVGWRVWWCVRARVRAYLPMFFHVLMGVLCATTRLRAGLVFSTV